VLLLVNPAHAQGPVPQHSDPHWQVSYWNNMALSGVPVIQETVAHLNWDWGYGSPHASVSVDRFSARWKRYIDLPAGTYRFTATSDDGIRVYVDDRLIIDQWNDHPARTYTSDVSLQAGHHLIVVEYYENKGHAVAKVSWAPVSVGPDKWRGEYFDNRWLSGSPALVRGGPHIDFDWRHGSPAAGIPGDGFSVRWRRTVHLENGWYRFTSISDDGVRIYVDSRLIIDQWHDHATQIHTGNVSLEAGDHLIVVEYYENRGLAVARFSWAPSIGPNRWQSEYFDNRWLSGSPALVRADASIDFNWGYGSPGTGIPSDGFSVRWTRTVHFESGLYRFTATTDDGVRLWVNGHALIDAWNDQSFKPHLGAIHVAGDVPIVMEYYENGGVAAARLTWARVDADPPPPSPNVVIVDDADVGFVQGGSTTAWRTASEGYNGGLTWTRNNDRLRPNYNWARWYPDLKPGRHEVFVYIPKHYSTTSSARYWVAHRDGFTLCRVSQAANGGRWVSLGTYRFRGTGNDYVSLTDVTYEPYLSRLLAFDAVKWMPR